MIGFNEEDNGKPYLSSTKAKYLESLRSAAHIVSAKGKLASLKVSFKDTLSFLDAKIRIFRKLGKKESQSRAAKIEKHKVTLETYWEALNCFYTAKFKKEEETIRFTNDELRNLLIGFLFIHRSPLRSQNVLQLKLHETLRLGKKGYETKLGHGFKTSGSSIHGDTHWIRLPSHINYWMAIYINRVRPLYPNADKTDQVFLTRRYFVFQN